MSQRSQKSLRHPGTIWWWNSGHSDLSKPFHNKGQRNYNTCKRYSDQEQQPKSPHRDTTTRIHKRALTCYILVKIYLLRKSQTRLNLVSRIIIFRESFAHFSKARQKYTMRISKMILIPRKQFILSTIYDTTGWKKEQQQQKKTPYKII